MLQPAQTSALPAPGGGNGEEPKDQKEPKKKPRKPKNTTGDDPDAAQAVKFNKKLSSKISSLSSKLTEVRCLLTQLNGLCDMNPVQ